METETMKVEMESETCCVCGVAGEDLLLPEEHDATAPPRAPPLRAVLLHLNHTKTVPSGRLCQSCITKALDAYSFSTQLASKGPPSLSEKIKALRRRLHELTQKIDVFIVVGGGTDGAYTEEDIIMVERGAAGEPGEPGLPGLPGLPADPGLPAGQRVRTLRGEPAYHCTVCPDTFQSAAEYRAHVRTHPEDARHSCWSCGAQFASQAAAHAHAQAHCTTAALMCQLCRHTAQSPAALRRHESTCPSRCPACGEQFPSRAALRGHVACHPTVCAVCFEQFPAPPERRAHQLLHNLDKQFVCGYDGCILRFSNRNNLVLHIRKSHAGGAPPPPPAAPPAPLVPCDRCDRTFASAAAMRRHARTHRHTRTLQDEEWRASEEEYLEVETLEDLDL